MGKSSVLFDKIIPYTKKIIKIGVIGTIFSIIFNYFSTEQVVISPSSSEISLDRTITMDYTPFLINKFFKTYYTTNGENPFKYGEKYDKEISIKEEDIVNNKIIISAGSKLFGIINWRDFSTKEYTIIEYTTTEYKLGDINYDGYINLKDADICLSKTVKASTGGELTETEIKKNDINGDGLITSSDASWILRYYSYSSVNSNQSIMTFEDFIVSNSTF